MKNIIIILSLICLLFAIPAKGYSQMELYVERQSLEDFIAGDGPLWGFVSYCGYNDNDSTYKASQRRFIGRQCFETIGVNGRLTTTPEYRDRVRFTINENNPHFINVSGVLFNRDKTILVAFLAGKDFDEYVIPEGVEKIGDFAFSRGGGVNCNFQIIGRELGGTRILLERKWPEIPPTVIIPNSVTAIGNNAFSESNLKNITIPSSVTTIGNNAFSGSNLKNITIPSSVTTIGNNAFSECRRLTHIYIPYSIVNIGAGAFRGSGLTSFTIPTAMDTISPGMLLDTRLSSIVIPENIVAIGRNAFGSNPYLSYVSIPKSVRFIGGFAFGDCINLGSINFPDGMNDSLIIESSAFRNTPWLDSIREGNAIYIGTILYQYRWTNYYKPEVIHIREGTTSITSLAFPRHRSFYIQHTVVIPNSIWYIGRDAMSIHNLKRMYVNWTSLDSLKISTRAFSYQAFSYIDSTRLNRRGEIRNRYRPTLIVPRGTKEMYQQSEIWREFRIRERRR